MQIPILLDRGHDKPLSAQLADQIRDGIRKGRILPGVRLPSSRALCEQLGIGRNTVVRAYEALTIEGFVESRAASGVFVTVDRQPGLAQPSATPAPPKTVAERPERMRPPSAPRTARGADRSRQRPALDFSPGRPNAKLFPVKAWRRLIQSCLSYGASAGFSDPGDAAGLPALRRAIAAHVALTRGIVAAPDQIFVTSGTQEALNIAARLFVSPGGCVVMEDPGRASAAQVFELAGARLVGVPVDEDGLRTSRLPDLPAALVLTTPAHQYPTGATLSVARRQELVDWARRHGCYILEDDYDTEFQYDGSPLPALAGTAPDCTIHIGTFSTTLGAGLHLGYMIVPAPLVDATRATKSIATGGVAWLEQAVLAEFLSSGAYAGHVTRCRAEYRESRNALLNALRRHFGRVEVSGEAVGLHVFWELPAGVPEAGRLEELAHEYRVGVYSLESADAFEIEPSMMRRRGLVLGFAGHPPARIEEGIARLSDCVDDTLDDHPAFVGELLLEAPPPHREPPERFVRRPGRLAPPHLQQPALRTVVPSRSDSRTRSLTDSPTTMRIVRGIYRYPIKGFSPQPMRGIELEAGKPFPFDRVFALARPGVPIDPEAPKWAKKGLFVMLMLDQHLAQVQTHLDPETLELTVLRKSVAPGDDAPRTERVLSVNLGTRGGRETLQAFVRTLVPTLTGTPSLVHAPHGHFMDKPDNVLSCINLATVRSLESQWGCSIDPLRFRANFYIDGLRPWEEFDWVGSDIALGQVLFRVDRRNGRCGATNVNPSTGERDLDIPGSLRRAFGHKDLGIYLVARKGGRVAIGDDVTVPDLEHGSGAPQPAANDLSDAGQSMICGGCYYIYDPAKGGGSAPPATPFAALPTQWRCPDCGTDPSNFRPHVPSRV